MRYIVGRHAVEEVLRAGERPVAELLILHESKGGHVGDLVRRAKESGAHVRWVARSVLDRLAQGANHQGLAAGVQERPEEELGGYLASLSESDRKRLVLVGLDHIQDPHNLGAIARSAACLGASGLVVPRRRAAQVTPGAVRASAGAIEKVRVFSVSNLADTLLRLKRQGFWIYGADPAGKDLRKAGFNVPLVLVVGSEGEGLGRLVRERCDELVAVSQSPGGVGSLNASCAASILLYEVSRQWPS